MTVNGLRRYSVGMVTAVAIAVPVIWFWKVALHLPMIIASPVASVCTVGINFVLTRCGDRATPRFNRIRPMTFAKIKPLELQKILSVHLPTYRRKVPHYQAVMLNNLHAVWQGRPQRLLDVGGGTGVIAEAMARLLPVGQVEAIDVVDRFCPGLDVQTTRYDGRSIPVEDGAFDAATLNNVLHHRAAGGTGGAAA